MNSMLPGLFLGGTMQPSEGAEGLPVVDPATGRETGAIRRNGAPEIDLAVQSAERRFRDPAWRRLPSAERGRMLMRLAALILEERDALARLEASDVGKPLSQARADITTAARYFEYYGGMVDKVLGSVIPVRWGALDLAVREPHGVCAQIVPWNFPLAMAARGIAPALAAGNCVVVKPAEDASLSLLRLGDLAIAAGLPPGALNVATGLGAEAGAALTAHPLVRHITFTGSVATGRQVMHAAAERIIPVNLELGGKSPVIVFTDADLDAAVGGVLRGFLVNAGQTCNACTRLVVERSIRAAFVERLAERLDAIRLGHPLDDPDVGPLVSRRQFERVQGHLDAARASSIEVRQFGRVDDRQDLQGGYFVRPTLLDGAGPDDPAFREEIFGPCLTVTPFDDEDEAVGLANATDYGLVAAVWTQSLARAMRLVHAIEAGQVYVNGFGTGGSVEVPFGGMKNSGIGREKGVEGFLNYTRQKSATLHFG